MMLKEKGTENSETARRGLKKIRATSKVSNATRGPVTMMNQQSTVTLSIRPVSYRMCTITVLVSCDLYNLY